jgi:ankyrin repeat protein
LSQSEYVENNSVDCTIEIPNIKLNEITDHVGRTLLHAACESGNYSLACFLLQAGSNPNAKETCGITPLGIAVINWEEQATL